MRIDEQVEAQVREALAGIVKQDSVRFESALRDLDNSGSLTEAIDLALAIISVVVSETLGRNPDGAELSSLAANVVAMESWLQPNAEQVHTLLVAIVNEKPIAEKLPAEDVVVLAFLVAGSLLAARSKSKKDQWWFNYLDEVEAVIERGNS